MKDALLNKINELKELASLNSKLVISDNNSAEKSNANKETALSKVIKTKEDADLFMKRLHALG